MSIADKVKAIQDEIRKRYGVDAGISISIYEFSNEHITKELANLISDEVVREIGIDTVYAYKNIQCAESQWVKLESKTNFSLSVFYPEPIWAAEAGTGQGR